MTKQAKLETHFPGFDGLRLFAAFSVLFSHAYLIATGSDEKEPFAMILGNGNIIGLYGVFTFFIISGFLLAHSLARNPNAIQFAINRILRIYPGFIFCILVTALLIGPMASSLDWAPYFNNPSVFAYIKTAIWTLHDSTLPNIFSYHIETNEYLQKVINGSLWSLGYEVMSYMLLIWLWAIFRNMKVVGVVLVLLAVASVIFPVAAKKIIPNVAWTLPYFAGGVFMYTVYQYIGLTWHITLLCLACLLFSIFWGWQQQAYAVFGAYLVVFLGSRPNLGSALAERMGDLSYGIYLFGWPLEQLVKQYTETESPWELLGFSLPLVLLSAAISFHFVERPALQFKKPLAKFIKRILIIRDQEEQHLAKRTATLVFLVATLGILLSKGRSWNVTQSLVEVIVLVSVGRMLAILPVEAKRRWWRENNSDL